jgi:hypothetical protein
MAVPLSECNTSGFPSSLRAPDAVLTRHSDNLEPTLTRNSYRVKDLAEQFGTKSAEIKTLFTQVAKRSKLHKFAVIPQPWWWRVPSPCWRNVGACGKTAYPRSLRACNLFIWHF